MPPLLMIPDDKQKMKQLAGSCREIQPQQTTVDYIVTKCTETMAQEQFMTTHSSSRREPKQGTKCVLLHKPPPFVTLPLTATVKFTCVFFLEKRRVMHIWRSQLATAQGRRSFLVQGTYHKLLQRLAGHCAVRPMRFAVLALAVPVGFAVSHNVTNVTSCHIVF